MVIIVEAVKELKDAPYQEHLHHGPTPGLDSNVEKWRCPELKKNPSGANFVFVFGHGTSRSPGQWILGSGLSRQLVNYPSLLTDMTDCRSECLTAAADGSELRITLKGTVGIQVAALGVVNTVRLLNVHYADTIESNILSFGLLEDTVACSKHRGGRRVLSSSMGVTPIMDM